MIETKPIIKISLTNKSKETVSFQNLAKFYVYDDVKQCSELTFLDFENIYLPLGLHIKDVLNVSSDMLASKGPIKHLTNFEDAKSHFNISLTDSLSHLFVDKKPLEENHPFTTPESFINEFNKVLFAQNTLKELDTKGVTALEDIYSCENKRERKDVKILKKLVEYNFEEQAHVLDNENYIKYFNVYITNMLRVISLKELDYGTSFAKTISSQSFQDSISGKQEMKSKLKLLLQVFEKIFADFEVIKDLEAEYKSKSDKGEKQYFYNVKLRNLSQMFKNEKLPWYFEKAVAPFLRTPLQMVANLRVEVCFLYVRALNSATMLSMLNDNTHLYKVISEISFPSSCKEISIQIAMGKVNLESMMSSRKSVRYIYNTSDMLPKIFKKGKKDDDISKEYCTDLNATSLVISAVIRADLHFSRRRHTEDHQQCGGHFGLFLNTLLCSGKFDKVLRFVQNEFKSLTKLKMCTGKAIHCEWKEDILFWQYEQESLLSRVIVSLIDRHLIFNENELVGAEKLVCYLLEKDVGMDFLLPALWKSLSVLDNLRLVFAKMSLTNTKKTSRLKRMRTSLSQKSKLARKLSLKDIRSSITSLSGLVRSKRNSMKRSTGLSFRDFTLVLGTFEKSEEIFDLLQKEISLRQSTLAARVAIRCFIKISSKIMQNLGSRNSALTDGGNVFLGLLLQGCVEEEKWELFDTLLPSENEKHHDRLLRIVTSALIKTVQAPKSEERKRVLKYITILDTKYNVLQLLPMEDIRSLLKSIDTIFFSESYLPTSDKLCLEAILLSNTVREHLVQANSVSTYDDICTSSLQHQLLEVFDLYFPCYLTKLTQDTKSITEKYTKRFFSKICLLSVSENLNLFSILKRSVNYITISDVVHLIFETINDALCAASNQNKFSSDNIENISSLISSFFLYRQELLLDDENNDVVIVWPELPVQWLLLISFHVRNQLSSVLSSSDRIINSSAIRCFISVIDLVLLSVNNSNIIDLLSALEDALLTYKKIWYDGWYTHFLVRLAGLGNHLSEHKKRIQSLKVKFEVKRKYLVKFNELSGSLKLKVL